MTTSHKISLLLPLRRSQRLNPLQILKLLLRTLVPYTHPDQNSHAARDGRCEDRRHNNSLRTNFIVLFHTHRRARIGVDLAEEAWGTRAGCHCVGDA